MNLNTNWRKFRLATTFGLTVVAFVLGVVCFGLAVSVGVAVGATAVGVTASAVGVTASAVGVACSAVGEGGCTVGDACSSVGVAAAVLDLVAPEPRRCRARTRGIFPLRFARKAIGIGSARKLGTLRANLLVEPGHIGLRIVPIETNGGPVRRLGVVGGIGEATAPGMPCRVENLVAGRRLIGRLFEEGQKFLARHIEFAEGKRLDRDPVLRTFGVKPP